MRLRYTVQAAAELDAILTYVQVRSPRGSQRVKSRVRAITRLLLQQPRIGKQTRDRRLRRVATSPYPYLIFYQVTDREIIIHGVRHAARDPITMPGR